jgi:tetratricopeptide (TPR) repeat protein
VEAVAWISARADLLATLGVLLAVLAYRRARPAEGGLSRGWYCAALLAGAAGLACKETAAVLPLLLMVADLLGPALGGAPSGRLGGVAVRSLPFWGLAVGYLALLSRPLQTYSAHLLAPGELWARIPGSLETLARYLGLLLLPVGMRPYYALERPAGLLAPWPLLGALLTAGLLLLLCALWRKAPRAAFGLAWLLITLLPVLDLAAVSPRPMGLADRYLYLPSVGFLLGAVFLADAAFRRLGPPWHRLPAAVTVLLALAGTLLTAGYLPVWRDNLSLYSRMVRDAPAAALPRLNLATTHLDRGDVDRGVALLEEAIRLEPTWVRPQIVLGLVLVGRGEVARGLALFDRAAPRAQEDINYYRMRSEAHLAARDPARAARVARDGLRRFPRAVDLHALLGRALEASGETAEAVLAQREVLRLDPQRAAAAEALGRLLARQGDFDGAGRALSRALDLEPRRLTALRLLALVRQAEGRREESLRLWERLADEAVDPALRGEAEAMRRALAGGRPGPAR